MSDVEFVTVKKICSALQRAAICHLYKDPLWSHALVCILYLNIRWPSQHLYIVERTHLTRVTHAWCRNPCVLIYASCEERIKWKTEGENEFLLSCLKDIRTASWFRVLTHWVHCFCANNLHTHTDTHTKSNCWLGVCTFSQNMIITANKLWFFGAILIFPNFRCVNKHILQSQWPSEMAVTSISPNDNINNNGWQAHNLCVVWQTRRREDNIRPSLISCCSAFWDDTQHL